MLNLEMRPSEIVWGYWMEVLCIEEDAIRLPVQWIEREWEVA